MSLMCMHAQGNLGRWVCANFKRQRAETLTPARQMTLMLACGLELTLIAALRPLGCMDSGSKSGITKLGGLTRLKAMPARMSGSISVIGTPVSRPSCPSAPLPVISSPMMAVAMPSTAQRTAKAISVLVQDRGKGRLASRKNDGGNC